MSVLPELSHFTLYVAVALLLAVTHGPGIFYVAARTLAGGQAEGIASFCSGFIAVALNTATRQCPAPLAHPRHGAWALQGRAARA